MSLKDKAMLINLSISMWTNSRMDRRAATEIETAHGAHDAGRYNKTLVNKVYLDPLAKFAASVRTYHYKRTLPWMDNGTRLLPAVGAMDYFAQIRTFKQTFEQMVDQFVYLYTSQLITDAQLRLGTLYNQGDYPSAADMRLKFSINTDLQPISEGSDFRISLGEDELHAIQQDIDLKAAQRTAAAQKNAWSRLREVVQNIHTRMTSDKVVIRDSLMDNTRDLLRVLPGLNIQNDPHMQAMCNRISSELIHANNRLRASAQLRAEVAEKAVAILEEIPDDDNNP